MPRRYTLCRRDDWTSKCFCTYSAQSTCGATGNRLDKDSHYSVSYHLEQLPHVVPQKVPAPQGCPPHPRNFRCGISTDSFPRFLSNCSSLRPSLLEACLLYCSRSKSRCSGILLLVIQRFVSVEAAQQRVLTVDSFGRLGFATPSSPTFVSTSGLEMPTPYVLKHLEWRSLLTISGRYLDWFSRPLAGVPRRLHRVVASDLMVCAHSRYLQLALGTIGSMCWKATSHACFHRYVLGRFHLVMEGHLLQQSPRRTYLHQYWWWFD